MQNDHRHSRAGFALALLLAAPLLGGACTSSASSGVGPSGVESSAQLGGLSDADAAKLCDWSAAELGGYMKSFTCVAFTTSTPDNRAECVSYLRSCDATVGQAEQCTLERAPDICAKVPACAPIEGCGGPKDAAPLPSFG